MALENWIDKQDGIDDILAEDINSIANAVIETQEEINEAVDTVYDDFGTTIDMSYTWQLGNDGIHTLPLINIQVLKNDSASLIFNADGIWGNENEVIILVSGSLEDLQAIGFVLNKKYRIEIRNKEIVSLKLLDKIVDQDYNPKSANAQSGKAVAEAVATEQNRADNTFANALKGSKSGSAILIDDVSSVSHEMRVKISSDTVTDLTAVKVSRCGKNLLDINQAHNSGHENAYDTFSINDNVITATSDNSTTKNVSMALFDGELPAGDYILSLNAVIENTPKHNRPNEILIFKNGSVLTISVVTKTDGSYSSMVKFTLSEKAKMNIAFYKSVNCSQETVSDTVYKVTLSNIQLELGTTVTEYEPYITSTEYTPTADGIVEGVLSLYPNTTLMTDKDGVIIDCEYNRDINKFSGVDVDVPTKTSELINDSNFATQDYVDEEIANFDFIKIVTELPATGLVNRTYFVPKEDPNTNDLYDEYMWVDGKWELITTKQIEVDLTNYYNKSQVDDALARVTPTIKTVMDEVAVASAQYYLGEVTELNITLPEDAEIGQEIIASWYNGETASTLAIDGTMLEFDYTPSANSRSEISCLWDGRYWAVIGNEMSVPVEEVTNDA